VVDQSAEETGQSEAEAVQSEEEAVQLEETAVQSEETRDQLDETIDQSDETTDQPEEAATQKKDETEQADAVAVNTYLEQGYYIVQPGDKLEIICNNIYNTTAMMDKICEENGIDDIDKIYVGQKLVLP